MLFLYIENYISEVADKLVKRQGTSDPDMLIRSRKNVTFSYFPMNETINGLYEYISAKKQILAVNDYLEGIDRQYASFHELGHVVLKHKGKLLLNCPGINNIKEEYEADLFATYMIVKHNNITKDTLNSFVLPKRITDLVYKFL